MKNKWESEDYLVNGFFTFCAVMALLFLASIPLCAPDHPPSDEQVITKIDDGE